MKAKYIIGVTSWPRRKNKQLYVQEGSVLRSIAVFRCDEDAEYFIQVLKEGGLPMAADDD